MDLGITKGRLQKLLYRKPEALAADVQLVFNNVISYNL
jgi:hypothetical protein